MKSMTKFFLLIAVIAMPLSAYSQFKVDFKKKIINQTNSRANHAADKAISNGLDAVENGTKDAASPGESQDNNQNQAEKPEASAEVNNGNNDLSADNEGGKLQPSAEPSLETYSKYDFIPGEKIIFFEDFSQDAVGDFPALWNTNGSAEVVTTNLFPGNWMKFDLREAIWTDALLNLPDNYTIEFDAIPTKNSEGEMEGYNFRLMQSTNVRSYDPGSAPGKAGFHYVIEYYGTPRYNTYINMDGADGLDLSGSREEQNLKQKVNQKYHMALWYQKGRVRLYQDQNKLFDLPKAFAFQGVKMDRIRFEYGAAMVTNIRIAVGAPDMRNKLLTEGKLVSYGIYFDVNKDVVKPESYSTLKTIAAIFAENPDLRVKIVGYTDSDGADAANLDLSKRRGASVKEELVKSFGIDASRLESDGLGETQPIAPNDTPANKALNRRVEFIKL
jgi:OOP family OmpA-OmpF porin